MEQFNKVYAEAISSSKTGVIGYVVQMKTNFGENIIGEIFNYDPSSHALTLKEPAENPKQSYRIINTEYIDSITITNKPQTNPSLELQPYNAQQIQAFEKRSLRAAGEEVKKIGVGVSKEAQKLFDAVSKTYRCAWKDKTILVVDADIRIEPPYTGDSCFGSNNTAVSRVKRVVNGERAKIEGGNWST